MKNVRKVDCVLAKKNVACVAGASSAVFSCAHYPAHYFQAPATQAKKTALYLSVNVFSRKVLFGDTIFTRDRHFTWSSEAREGLAAYRLKEYLHISVINI